MTQPTEHIFELLEHAANHVAHDPDAVAILVAAHKAIGPLGEVPPWETITDCLRCKSTLFYIRKFIVICHRCDLEYQITSTGTLIPIDHAVWCCDGDGNGNHSQNCRYRTGSSVMAIPQRAEDSHV